MQKLFICLLTGCLLANLLQAQQACTTIGQTPQSAFPVCGTARFKQDSVPICGIHSIPVPGCGGTNAGYFDTNPYWYKFTCYTSGTLGFVITPNNLGDDYDWQLFDITGHNPADVFTNPALFVCGNWSGTYGLTGASATASGNIQCASYPPDNIPTFSHWPTLIKGHQYLLLVSHYTQTQSGYTLSFGGGTASITDTVQPHLLKVKPSCDATQLYVKLNKKMRCASLAADGSDFTINTGPAQVIGAGSFYCGGGFDMDSLQLSLNQALLPGHYTLVARNGTDNNTLLDNCGTPIPVGDTAGFDILPQQPTPMDSVEPVACSPNSIRLVFSKGIRCSSIAFDGSDFTIHGPVPVTVTSASGLCVNGNTGYIDLHLASPIRVGGNFQVILGTGSDGNTLVDECGQVTPAGSTVAFQTADTVSAAISYQVLWGCRTDTLLLDNHGGSSIRWWTWSVDGDSVSNDPHPVLYFSSFGDKNIQLVVSNNVCSDTSSTTVALDNTLVADFETQPILCPADKATFLDKSTGHIVAWFWDFGDGSTDNHPAPPDHYYVNNPLADQSYPVKLMVTDNLGCHDTATRIVKKLHSCIIAVPSAFTPNGDGINDYLYPLNGFKADNLEFRVFNRYGQLVFETTDWTRKWDGTLGGRPQGPGTFVWTLQYTDRDTGQRVFQKGSTVLIR